MQIESSPLSATITYAAPSSRKGRLEGELARVIAAGCPRSTIREAVMSLVDHLRAQRIPASNGLEAVMTVAMSVPADGRAFGTPVDFLPLVARWASQRYARAD